MLRFGLNFDLTGLAQNPKLWSPLHHKVITPNTTAILVTYNHSEPHHKYRSEDVFRPREDTPAASRSTRESTGKVSGPPSSHRGRFREEVMA